MLREVKGALRNKRKAAAVAGAVLVILLFFIEHEVWHALQPVALFTMAEAAQLRAHSQAYAQPKVAPVLSFPPSPCLSTFFFWFFFWVVVSLVCCVRCRVPLPIFHAYPEMFLGLVGTSQTRISALVMLTWIILLGNCITPYDHYTYAHAHKAPLALPVELVDANTKESAALFRQLAERLSTHPAGQTLYRALDNPDACPSLADRLTFTPNKAAAAL